MSAFHWTREQKLEAAVKLPWTLHFSKDEIDGSLIATVEELPDAIATGENDRELAQALYDAIEASIESRLEHDDPIPLPAGVAAPWMAAAPPVPVHIIHDDYLIVLNKQREPVASFTATGVSAPLVAPFETVAA